MQDFHASWRAVTEGACLSSSLDGSKTFCSSYHPFFVASPGRCSGFNCGKPQVWNKSMKMQKTFSFEPSRVFFRVIAHVWPLHSQYHGSLHMIALFHETFCCLAPPSRSMPMQASRLGVGLMTQSTTSSTQCDMRHH